MSIPENPPSFVVRIEAEKAAGDNGFRVAVGEEDGWVEFASTTAPGHIWIAAAGADGPWWLSFQHTGAGAELKSEKGTGPGSYTMELASAAGLHSAVDLLYRLSRSLPPGPLAAFEAATANLSRTTEGERLVVQRIGQDKFRHALLDYWGGTCPITGITDARLLRASHIVPWSECVDDAQRLDVHNGLLLSALWDAAFDCGLISFSDNGIPIFSPRLSQLALKALAPADRGTILGLTDRHRHNLAWHRKHILDN